MDVYRSGLIKIYRLIRPAPNYYTQWTTAIHGLTYDDTMEADDFPEVWAEIKPLLEGLPLVAHNSPFDEGCLRAVHELYGMTYPNYKFYCTCRTSRKVFGKDLPNHQLHTVAERCGYNLENHHHALADAEACAQIALLIIPEPKKAKPAKKANKDTHVGDLFDSLIPQTGTVEVVTDEKMKKELWQDWFIEHFPGGPTDPGYVLLKFESNHATYWIEGTFIHKKLD